jgi:hypothetical protein
MHRRKVLISRERSLLPAMQIYVEAWRGYDNATNLLKTVTAQWKVIQEKNDALLKDLYVVTRNTSKTSSDLNISNSHILLANTYKDIYKKKFSEYMAFRKREYTPMKKQIRIAKRNVNIHSNLYYRGEQNVETQARREFIMRCPAEECRGFISASYICGICTKKTCSDCLEIIDNDHTCKNESIESAKAIKKETRSCPKCAARIFKIDGCDQMWCTVDGCNTAFSWNTGHIVSGRVHNPHYYEWLRSQGKDLTPNREPGDIPCGGLPDEHMFVYRIMNLDLTAVEKNKLFEINRNLAEFEWRVRGYPIRMNALENKEINVKYLMKTIDEAEWQRQLEFNEMRFVRKKEIGQILQTFITFSAEIMRNIYESSLDENGVWLIRNHELNNLEALRNYTNEQFIRIGNIMKFAVPTIGENWNWKARSRNTKG